MVANRINGKEIAEEIRKEIATKVNDLKNNHQVTPGLAVILVGNDPASAVYAIRNFQGSVNSVQKP